MIVALLILIALLFILIESRIEDLLRFLEKQKTKGIEYKLTKLEKYSELLKEGLITYTEFKKQTK